MNLIASFNLNEAHLHLLLNHFPILGSIIITLLFIVALIFRNVFLQKVSLWFLAGIAVLTAATFTTGDGAKSAILNLNLPDVSLTALHSHEEMARVGLIMMFFTGAISLGSAFFYRNKAALPRPLLAIILVILLINVAVFSYISYLGGLIMHPEIRSAMVIPLIYPYTTITRSRHRSHSPTSPICPPFIFQVASFPKNLVNKAILSYSIKKQR